MAFDVITPANLGRGAIATTPTLTTLYTVPALTRAMVKDIDVANTSTTAMLNISLYLVPSGDAAGTGNMLLPSSDIPPKGNLQWTGSQVLNAGDKIQATGSAAGLTVHISGGVCI